MAEPVSTIASIIGIAGACATCAEHLYKASVTIKDASEEAQRLSRDLYHNRNTFLAVQELYETHKLPYNEAATELLHRAATALRKLDAQMLKVITKRPGKKASVNRSAWLFGKKKIMASAKDIRSTIDCLHILLSAGLASSSQDFHRESLLLEGATLRYQFEFSSAWERAHASLSDALSSQAKTQRKHTVLLEEIASNTSLIAKTSAFAYQAGSYPSTITLSSAKYEIATLMTFVTQLQSQNQCCKPCNCRCHVRHHARSSTVLAAYLGQLCVAYAGLPLCVPACTEEDCRRRLATWVEFQYVFPPQVWEKAIYLFAAVTGFGGPVFCLTVRNRTEYTQSNSIFQMALVGNLEGIKKLLEKRQANPNDVNSTYGETALWWAVKGGRPEVARFLLNAGADPNIQNDRNMTIIEQTVGRLLCEPKGSRFILQFHDLFACVDYKETFNFTEMHQAALGMLPLSVEEVLGSPAFDQDIEARDKEGKTPLYWAARKGNEIAVRQLIHAGADVNAADVGKDTPLGAASRSCSSICVQMLLDAGAYVESKDCFGYTALANVGKWQTEASFAECLVHAGASPNSLDIHGATAFARSARYNHCEIGAYLMDHGADIDRPDYEGNPPIFEAAIADAGEFLVMLLSRGARQDVRNNAGSTLLHILATHSSPKTLNTLAVSELAKVDADARDRKGRTASELINKRVSISIELRHAFFECIQPCLRHADKSPTSGIEHIIANYSRKTSLVVASLAFLPLVFLFIMFTQHSGMFRMMTAVKFAYPPHNSSGLHSFGIIC